jgi:acetyl-CoA acetyltransferase
MAIATKEVTLDHDEGPRPDTTLEELAALQPVVPKQQNLAMSDIHLRELREAYAVTTLYSRHSWRRLGTSPTSAAARSHSGFRALGTRRAMIEMMIGERRRDLGNLQVGRVRGSW